MVKTQKETDESFNNLLAKNKYVGKKLKHILQFGYVISI